MGRPLEEAEVQGWLDDIENALRGIFTSSSDEDEAFDNAMRSLDALRPFVLAQGRVIEAARRVADANHDPMRDDIQELRAALAAGGDDV